MGQSDRYSHLGVHFLFLWAIELAVFPLYPTRRLREGEDIEQDLYAVDHLPMSETVASSSPHYS